MSLFDTLLGKFSNLERKKITKSWGLSCLENPRDRGAWWAALCGAAQSRTWLKRLSSSSRGLSGHNNQSFCWRVHIASNPSFVPPRDEIVVEQPYLKCSTILLNPPPPFNYWLRHGFLSSGSLWAKHTAPLWVPWSHGSGDRLFTYHYKESLLLEISTAGWRKEKEKDSS